MGIGEEVNGSRWKQLRVELEGEANGYGNHPWIDEADIQSALMEAYSSGIDAKLILSCREACASLGDFHRRLVEMRNSQPRPWRILAVDDEKAFLNLLKLNLERTRRYKVAIQSKPDDVVRSVEDFNPDLVIMDVMMPGKDGLELARSIKDIGSRPELPIIMLTALLDAEVAHAVTHDGLLHLSKPIGVKELVHCIEKHLSDVAPVL